LKTGVSFARFDYGYDNVNRRTYVKRDGGKGDKYTYDSTDQITGVQYEVTIPEISIPEQPPADALRIVNYNWDAVGNRITVTDNSTQTNYTANHLNQYISINDSLLTYDANGNLKTYNEWTYRYDAQNRLTRAEKGSTVVSFSYDARNWRVRQTANGVARFFYYDELNLIEETNNRGVQLAQ